jgi:hypothetical protein
MKLWTESVAISEADCGKISRADVAVAVQSAGGTGVVSKYTSRMARRYRLIVNRYSSGKKTGVVSKGEAAEPLVIRYQLIVSGKDSDK